MMYLIIAAIKFHSIRITSLIVKSIKLGNIVHFYLQSSPLPVNFPPKSHLTTVYKKVLFTNVE